MASIRKVGKRWRVEVFVNGQRGSKVCLTKAEAVAWSVDAERRMQSGSFSTRIVRDAFERYAEEVSTKKAGVKWEQTRLAFYARDPIALVRLDELSARHTSELRDRRLKVTSGGTWRRDAVLLSNCLKVAVKEWKWALSNPFTDTALPKDNEPRDRRVTDDEIARLRQASSQDAHTISHRALLAFEFAIETGMRGGEICAMTRANVHEKHVHIPGTQPGERKSKRRDVALSLKARAILRSVMALGLDPVWGMDQRQKDANFRKLVRAAGIDGLNFHDSRHEAATRLAKKMHVLALARMLGHADIRQLQTYYNESAADIADQLD